MRALISVSDKTGLIDFARGLHDQGVDIISTGGTAALLSKEGIPATEVSQITGFPECLDGRVKTLHPAIHAGILAIRDKADHMDKLKELNLETIDIVVINLYPFKETVSKPDVTLEDAIENIDIGGPTMLRAAAKNHRDVLVVCDPADYGQVLKNLQAGKIDEPFKYKLALKVFEHTASYDALIASYLREQINAPLPDNPTFTYEKIQDLRYGENPHQKAGYYKEINAAKTALVNARQIHGKELSFNNINDTNGALQALREFDGPTVVAVKHANPCGIGMGENIFEAYKKAYDADPISIFGGIVAANCEIDGSTAELLNEIFLEIVIAPSFSDQALEILKNKKNIRLLLLEDISSRPTGYDMKKVDGGLLVQDRDDSFIEEMKVVTERAPSEEEMEQLLFAMKAVKHIKSNGIVLAKEGRTIGIGPGQVNRIWAVENAIRQATDSTEGAVMASDAFFPFDDCVEKAGQAGIRAIIQPGGSIKDEDSIKKANELGVAMVFTGMRHFKH